MVMKETQRIDQCALQNSIAYSDKANLSFFTINLKGAEEN